MQRRSSLQFLRNLYRIVKVYNHEKNGNNGITETTKHTKGTKIMNEIIYKDECFAIQGAIFDVYKEMDC